MTPMLADLSKDSPADLPQQLYRLMDVDRSGQVNLLRFVDVLQVPMPSSCGPYLRMDALSAVGSTPSQHGTTECGPGAPSSNPGRQGYVDPATRT